MLIVKGQSYLVNTFAGIAIVVKITGIIDIDSGAYEAKLTNKNDIKRLSKAGVPVTEKDKNSTFCVFDFQVVKKVKNRRNRKIIKNKII
jgi:hypothetical protein